jgi:dihydroorotate dehydrogenase electron transfer subunit
MAAPPPDARSLRSELIDVRPSGCDGVVLRIRPEVPQPQLRAGRFFMLRRADGLSPAIPRPFSIYRQTGEDLEFLIKVMGPGTRALAESAPGTSLVTVGPLGNGLPQLEASGAPWVMLAGGIGSAPFFEAVRQALAGSENAPPVDPGHLTLIYGGRDAGYLYDLDLFLDLGVRVLATTDDGSQGFHGNVVQCLEHLWSAEQLPPQVRLLACGPEPMMKAVARVAAQRELPCWLSLETYMGCGVGICNGCAVPTEPGGELDDWPVAKCCVDGPVFPASAIRL